MSVSVWCVVVGVQLHVCKCAGVCIHKCSCTCVCMCKFVSVSMYMIVHVVSNTIGLGD